MQIAAKFAQEAITRVWVLILITETSNTNFNQDCSFSWSSKTGTAHITVIEVISLGADDLIRRWNLAISSLFSPRVSIDASRLESCWTTTSNLAKCGYLCPRLCGLDNRSGQRLPLFEINGRRLRPNGFEINGRRLRPYGVRWLASFNLHLVSILLCWKACPE